MLSQQDLAPICLRTNPVTRLRADLPTEPTLRWHRTAIYHRQTDSAAGPAITTNDCACTPTINRPTDRQALCLTTITTAAGTVLPPEQTFAASTCS